MTTSTRNMIVIATSVLAAGVISSLVIGWFGQDPGLKPLSPCEANCIRDNSNDANKRLDCMLKCVADGK